MSNSLEKIDKLFYYVGKFLLPVLFLGIGIYLLIQAVTPDIVVLNNDEILEVKQSPLFLYSAIIFIIVSIVWLLYIFDMIKSIVGYAIMAIMLVGSAVILYLDYQTVQEEVVFNERYETIENEIKTRLQDIEAAESEFKKAKGTYTNDINELINFVKEGKTMDVIKIGPIPPRKISPEERDLIYGDNRPIDQLMNEFEATYLARRNNDSLEGMLFKRDTVFVPVLDSIFLADNYLESRSKIGGELPFIADSLKYVPYTQDNVELDTASVMKGELPVQTLRIRMTHPMEDPIEGYKEYTIGALDDNHLRQSWDQ